MQHGMTSFAVFAIPLLLSGCGGGNNNAYDGTWTAAYPAADKTSISDTKTVLCDTPSAILVIKDSVGTTTQNTTCTTTIITGGVATTYPPQITHANISVSIEGKKDINEKDVMNAIVNGVTHTGQCISTVACSAVSAAGDTLSLTR
jgi:hypothetical protein